METYEEGNADYLYRTNSLAASKDTKTVTCSKRESTEQYWQQHSRRQCPTYFGITSCRHHITNDYSVENQAFYDDDDNNQLLSQSYSRRWRWDVTWWKLFMAVGLILVQTGVIAILVGYLIPPRYVLTKSSESRGADIYIDENSQEYNTNLDICKVIGFVLFCMGGATMAMSVLFSSLLMHYCEDQPDNLVVNALPNPGDTEGSSPPTLISASCTVKGVQVVEIV